MRRPDDRRWMLVARLAPLVDRLRCAFSDITLVLMADIAFLLMRIRRGGESLSGRFLQGSAGLPSPLL
jgi:hypothetical protein